MKSVNLVPADDRGRGRGFAGVSGGGAYAVVAVLAVLAVLVVALAASLFAGKTVDDRTATLASLEQELQSVQAEQAQLSTYTTFRALAQARVQTVKGLAESRFDWGGAFGEVARVVPQDTWLTSMVGTVSPGTSAGSGGGSGLRGAIPSPAIEIVGCTTSQPDVAKTMTALRRIDGVDRVSLSSSEKAGAQAGGGGAGGDCRQGRSTFPQFQMVVFFDPPATAPAAATTTAATTAAPAAAEEE